MHTKVIIPLHIDVVLGMHHLETNASVLATM